MFSINKEEIKSQYFCIPLKSYEKEDHKNTLNPSNTTHTKLIHKKKKHPLLGHKKKEEDKFVRHLTKDLALKSRVENE